MTTKAIQNSEIEGLKISSLPSNPTANPNYGGLGYSAAQMKAAFDALPLFIIERLNTLIADITASPPHSVSGAIKTGIRKNWDHTLADLFADFESGQLASYLTVGGSSLASVIASLKEDIAAIKAHLGMEVEE